MLAHEIGHTLELHPEAGLVRAMGLSAAAQLVFAGSTGTATNIGLLLTQLRYTRVAEREADAHAMRMLKNCRHLGKGLRRLLRASGAEAAQSERQGAIRKSSAEKEEDLLGTRIFTSEILRTHPLTADRLALVRAQPAYPATPALSDDDWRALREMCGAVTIAPRPTTPPAAQRPSTANPGPVKRRPLRTAPADRRPSRPPMPDRDIAEATKALQANPYDVAALQRRARAYSKKGQHAEALADYTKATQLRPSDANLQVGRGAAHFSLRQYELALVAYDEALRLDHGNVAARNGRGNTNRALKRYEEALADFDDLLKIRPDLRVRLLQSRPDQRRHGPGRGRHRAISPPRSASTRTTPAPTRSAACCTRRPARANRPSPISAPPSRLRLASTRAGPGRSAWRASG